MTAAVCDRCQGTGWVLQAARQNERCLWLLPCPHPGCDASGRSIEALNVSAAGLFRAETHNVVQGVVR